MKREQDPYKLPDEALCTVRQAAVITNIGEGEMRKAIADDEIEFIYVGSQPRIPRWCIRVWEERRISGQKQRVERPVKRILRKVQ